jgi:hypothetical protein
MGSWRCVLDTTLCDIFVVCQRLATGQWFSPGTCTPVSSTKKTDCHDITVMVNNYNHINKTNKTSNDLSPHTIQHKNVHELLHRHCLEVVGCFVDMGVIVDHHCFEVIVCFVDVGVIVDHHCLDHL